MKVSKQVSTTVCDGCGRDLVQSYRMAASDCYCYCYCCCSSQPTLAKSTADDEIQGKCVLLGQRQNQAHPMVLNWLTPLTIMMDRVRVFGLVDQAWAGMDGSRLDGWGVGGLQRTKVLTVDALMIARQKPIYSSSSFFRLAEERKTEDKSPISR